MKRLMCGVAVAAALSASPAMAAMLVTSFFIVQIPQYTWLIR